MENSESLTQGQASNRIDPDFEFLEEIEIRELERTTSTIDTGTQEKETETTKKRKGKERSDVWMEFTKVFIEVGDPPELIRKAKCKKCEKLFAADPRVNGTTSMRKHLGICKKKETASQSQTTLNLDMSGSLTSARFSQEKSRIDLCVMIILDELPFRFVEREGFKRFARGLRPEFKIPSRHTIRADCVKLFAEQKDCVKLFFSARGVGRVSITTDCWTSINNTNYICVTAHCITKDWILHKKIINFAKICSHKGEDLAATLVAVLEYWGLQKVMCCTMDNAYANDVAIRHLISKLAEKNMLIAGGKYFHQRCAAHIVNLAVCDGLEDIGMSVRRVREAVRWIKGSPSRSESFKEIAKISKMDTSKFLCLDVPTRWNSTYMMLEAALPYEHVMTLYAGVNKDFVRDLGQKQHKNLTIGVPKEKDWIEVKRMCGYLEKFYNLTRTVSGSKYVTSHDFFKEMCDIFTIMNRLESQEDDEIKSMATKMKKKLGKYWLEEKELNPKLNKIIYIAAVLDPRQKMKHVGVCLKFVYGERRANELVEEINKSMYDLFELYHKELTPVLDQTSPPPPTPLCAAQSDDLRFLGQGLCSSLDPIDEEEDDMPDSSEITLYLTEKQYRMSTSERQHFDVLMWWRKNIGRYPILSEMAKDILAMPISSVASEAAFSTGGRVLSQFRSSLTPSIVEALICAEDWLRSNPSDDALQDEEDVPESDLEKEYENGEYFISI